MLFIHSHKGYLIPIIIVLNLILAELISERITKDENFYQNNDYPIALAFFSSALILYYLDLFLSSKQQKVKDNRTGEEIILNKKTHSFFFITIKIWAIICLSISMTLLTQQALF